MGPNPRTTKFATLRTVDSVQDDQEGEPNEWQGWQTCRIEGDAPGERSGILTRLLQHPFPSGASLLVSSCEIDHTARSPGISIALWGASRELGTGSMLR